MRLTLVTILNALESFQNLNIMLGIKVTVQGDVVALGSHLATLYQELDFYEAISFLIINFHKEKANMYFRHF